MSHIVRHTQLPQTRLFTRPGSSATFTRRLLSTWIQDSDVSQNGGKRRLTGRIHVLGMGNVGTFVAHSLASQPSPPPITLLLHRLELYKAWRANNCLSVNKNGLDDSKTGFDISVLHDKTWYTIPHSRMDDAEKRRIEDISHGVYDEDVKTSENHLMEDKEPIECLIVTVKAPMTTRALRSICHRLTPDSTVLFLQNGLGVVEEVNQKVFPDPRHRPHYICGIFSHGLTHKAAFQVYYHGVGATILGLPTNKTRDIRDKDMDIGPSTDYLLRILTSPSPLMAVSKTPASFQLHQLDKLAVNSVINPLTTVMNCKNGELIHNYNSTRIMWQLLKEISSVFCALPELQDILDVRNRFPPERLRWLITRVASKTADNTSSMLQDVQAGKSTEIEYLNGYIVRRGDELGIECVANSILKHLVLGQDPGHGAGRIQGGSQIIQH